MRQEANPGCSDFLSVEDFDVSEVGTCRHCGMGFRYVRRGKRRTLCSRCGEYGRLARQRADAKLIGDEEALLRARRMQHARKVRHLYAISVELYDLLVAEYDGRCWSCGALPAVEGTRGQTSLHVDHDHRCCPGPRSCGQCIRGMLCHRCNLASGYAGDDPQRLRALADYLERFI